MKITRPRIIGKQCGVYRLQFNDGWFYIGGSKHLCRRFSQWRNVLMKDGGKRRNIKAIIEDLFEVEMVVLFNCLEDMLPIMEQAVIDCCFNDQFCLNSCPNSNNNYGRRAAFGQTYRVYYKQETPKPKPVAQFTLSNELVKIHPSVRQAAKYFNARENKISDAMYGRKNTRFIGGFVLKRVAEDGSFIEPPGLRKILKIGEDGGIAGEYYIPRAAAESIGADRANVEKVLAGKPKRKTVNGYVFKYAD